MSYRGCKLFAAMHVSCAGSGLQCCAAGPQSAVPAVRSTRGAVRAEGPLVLRVLRLNILWYLFI